MNQEPKHIQNNYYTSDEYHVLAGPYDITSPSQVKMMNNVVEDMKRGNIDYRVASALEFNHFNVERTGMILSKGEKND